MNIAESTIRFKTFSIVITLVLIIGGLFAYTQLSRFEDPEFTIKDVQIITQYPGASSKEVEKEVTEPLETAIQQLGQLDEITSLSQAGVSIITATMKDRFTSADLPQVFDELRRKVNDAQKDLPPGARPSQVIDDFGDVFGVLLAIHGQGFSYRELLDQAEFLQKKLLQVNDVAKITIWGAQKEQIIIEISRSKMAKLGISMEQVYAVLKQKNLVAPAGRVVVGNEYLRISPTGDVNSIDDIRHLSIKGIGDDKIIYLKDIARVTREYIEPPQKHMRFNGEPSLALAISTAPGGNVVTMGKALQEKIKTIQSEIPLGIKLNSIYYQGEIVENAVNSFIINLAEALAIVIVVLMIFMGIRSGILIGVVLLLTVCASFVVMYIFGISLQRISLGALIIALGMLVDNAIVVTEGMLIRINQGENRIQAARAVVSQTMWPLLAATIIAVLAFAAIGLSSDSTGEFLRSLFQVMLISLGMSWIIAITLTPLFCTMFLKKESVSEDPYRGFVFVLYKKLLTFAIRFRWATIVLVVCALFASVLGFQQLDDSFFPDSTADQFMVNFWLPEGTDIRVTSAQIKQLESKIQAQEGVKNVASFIGGGAPRFILVYAPEKSYSSYGFLLVKMDDYRKIDRMIKFINHEIKQNMIDVNPKIEKIRLGPGGGFPWEARFIGDDPNVLRALSTKAKEILFQDGGAKGIRDDWRARVTSIQPEVNDTTARRAGITRRDIAMALQTNYVGRQVGVYREDDKLIPIVSRLPTQDRSQVNSIDEVLVWSPFSSRMVPLRQVVKKISTVSEDANIHRQNKERVITVQAEPKTGTVGRLFSRVKQQVEAIPLPLGYRLEWGGEYEDSSEAQAGLSKNLPVTALLMLLITIGLFNALRQPAIIWLTVPLALIGVTFGLLVTNEPFGFMALLGFLSLSGMLIKNAIVLIDEIDLQIREGKSALTGILDASVSRMRPVTMAAITTILGMIPLLFDVFFKGMAVTIMFGLAFATVLTLLVVPVLYAVFFKVKNEK